MADYSNDTITEMSADIKGDATNRISVGRLLKYAVFAFSILFFAYSVTVYIYASANTVFAEKYTVTVSAFFRQILAGITGIIPFSLAETIAVAGSLFFLLMLVRAVVLRFCYKEKGRLLRFFLKLLCVVLAAFSVFINTFGICYKRRPVSYMLGIDSTEISEEDLLVTAYLCAAVASGFCDDVSRLPDGMTVMPYGFDEMVERIHNGYKNIMSDVPDNISVKPVALSKAWTYTHISGMYFPFTGESNINVNYPDFIVAFSCAHEIAHQLGIADENDANMMAFLALSYSDDIYLMYSAYMNAFDYLLTDLDSDSASLLMMTSDRRVLSEFSAYSFFIKDYRNKTVSDISSGLNDAYLKVNGVQNGTRSYGEVTKLICGFMKSIYPAYYQNG